MNSSKPEHLTTLLVQVCRAHRSRAQTLFSAFGLHVGQDMILLELSKEDGQTLSELAEKLNLQAPTVTRMARRMGKNGLLTRRNCSQDGRAFRIHLTTKGRDIKVKLDKALIQLEAETTRNLTPQQQASFVALLTEVKTSLTAPSQ